MRENRVMRIGELAARTGASVRALRYYEEQGLLTPHRTTAGQRIYSPQHEEAIRNIQDLIAAGFCSSVIATLLPVLSDPGMSTGALQAAVDAAEERLLSEQRAIKEEVQRLTALRSRWGLAPHVHVSSQGEEHDEFHNPETAPFDHRDRRLRHRAPVLP
ncbi:MerR family transcriptional regulator [Microbacterium hominis]|uniref:MerR family transcriptional regulator n=2 Tax=Microbacterium hominis TaxID=162426 RepID=UPI0012FBACCC